jgi:diguanylate cyclase (GGDEF)-like protein/PAS domain S-box-containing protein
VSGPLTDQDVADGDAVALVVVQDGDVRWHNDAAARLVARHGGSWHAAAGPLAVLRDVPAGTRRGVLRWPSPVGGTRWWQVSCRALDGALLYEVVDTTDRRAREQDAHDAGWRLSRLERMPGLGTWLWEPGSDRVVWSPALLRLFGLPEDHGLDAPALRAMVHPDDIGAVEAVLDEALRTGAPFTFTTRMLLPGGDVRGLECAGEVFTDATGAPVRVLGTVRDVTEQQHARAELARLADHDPLTGVVNRRRIAARLAECVRDGADAVLLLVDVDHFKDVNDLRGHAVGDAVLRWLVRCLERAAGPDALVGRHGGDEFAVVVPRCGTEQGLAIARRLCVDVAAEPVPDVGPPLRVTVSAGVAGAVQDVEATLGHADLALYEAKGAGRNRARLFAPDQYRQAAHRVSVLERVAAALRDGAMELDAQPIVDLATGATTRHELLVRLRDGLQPPLGPAEFLPTAERTDLVLDLDRWVLDRAVRALSAPGGSNLCLEVNLSARSLEDPGLGAWIVGRLAADRVDPARLGVEITETTAIDSLDAARALGAALTGAGCGFALDDFGSGHTSFSYLKHLPFTTVKISGEFARTADRDRVDRALVGAVAGVARELGLRTVAEQVDRPVLVDVLRGLGVDDGQGFHLGRPRPLDGLLDGERAASASGDEPAQR